MFSFLLLWEIVSCRFSPTHFPQYFEKIRNIELEKKWKLIERVMEPMSLKFQIFWDKIGIKQKSSCHP